MADVLVTSVPEHVPEHLVRHLDSFDLPGDAADPQSAWKRVQEDYPALFWTTSNGGHWVATSAEAIETVWSDHERFSTANFLVPKTPRPVRALPNSADPPEHLLFKRLITPAFSPRGTRDAVALSRQVSAELVEQVAPQGRCEFIADVAVPATNAVAAAMFGLPRDQTDVMRALTDSLVRSPDPEQRRASLTGMGEFVEQRLAERRADPGDDLFSLIATAEIDGRPIRPEEAMGLALVLMTGPLENTTNVLGFILYYLARHPELQERLAADPEAIPAAAEELLRRNGIAAISREVREDTEVLGVQLRAGEMVQLPSVLPGFDPQRVTDPMTVDWTRAAKPDHAIFGMGIHRCAGAYLVREEVKAVLEAWVTRIPRCSPVAGSPPSMGTGHLFTISSLALEWPVAEQGPEVFRTAA